MASLQLEQQQQEKQGQATTMMQSAHEERDREGGQLQSLPMESSPYVKYTNLEDYKCQAYGTKGHLEPVETGRGGGPTDAPTLSGSNLTDAQAQVVDSLHHKGNA